MKPSISLGLDSINEISNLYPHKKFCLWHIPELDRELLLRIKSQLGRRLISQNIYEQGMPDLDMVRVAQYEFSKANQSDDSVILGIGGGSLMDFLKVLRFQSMNSNWLIENLDKPINAIPENCKKHHLILMPTTAGTGSEITGTATIWNFKKKTKHSLFGSQVYADYAIVDPQLCYGAPWVLTRDSALDALSHALESIWNKNANHQTISLAIDACQKICTYLPNLKFNLNNPTARFELSHAALLAGIAMSHTQTALAHALSYDDTINDQISHGYACGSWLPIVWQLILDDSKNTLVCEHIKRAIGDVINSPIDMVQWLSDLGVNAHDPLNITPEILYKIKTALLTPRGMNFIGHTYHHENI